MWDLESHIFVETLRDSEPSESELQDMCQSQRDQVLTSWRALDGIPTLGRLWNPCPESICEGALVARLWKDVRTLSPGHNCWEMTWPSQSPLEEGMLRQFLQARPAEPYPLPSTSLTWFCLISSVWWMRSKPAHCLLQGFSRGNCVLSALWEHCIAHICVR